jgi:hypothetical protein
VTYDNIPEELKQLPQWMPTRTGTKIPFNPITNSGEWQDAQNWMPFTEAASYVLYGIAEHVGLVLRKENEIVGIDLDNKPDNPATEQQLKFHSDVIRAFGQSYMERSVSNTEDYPGYHIFIKGKISRTVNKEHIELRCDNFIVVTGDVDGDKPRPVINGFETQLTGLARFLGGEEAPRLAIDSPQLLSDDQVYENMRTTKSDKWRELWNDFQIVGSSSESEKDMVLIGWIYNYTQNREQMARVFFMYPYSQRMKSGNKQLSERMDYIWRTIDKVIAEKNPPVDLSKFKLAPPKPVPVPTVQIHPLVIPPQSLISEMVQYGLAISHKPSEHTALAGALALLAGICGRSYTTPTNGGTALYLFLIAETGAGKESAKMLVKKLLNNVQRQGIGNAPDMAGFKLISGPGIHSMLTEQQGMSTVLLENEGVNKLALISKKASPLHEELLSTLLGLYSDNQPGGMLQRTGHATKEKKLGTIQFPAVSLLFEGVPEEFDRNLNDEMISGGLLPRFITIERIGGTVRNFEVEDIDPSPWLQQQMLCLVKHSIEMQHNNKYQRVDWTEEARDLLYAFASKTDEETKARSTVVTAQLWNRAYENTLRVASLVAVAYDMDQPVITKPIAEWAINFVMHSLWTMEKRFTTGNVGEGDSVQLSRLRELIEKYCTASYEEIKNQYTKAEAHAKGLVSYSYLQNKTQSISAFKKDRLGSTNALKKTLDTMVNTGELQRIEGKALSGLNIGSALHYGIIT